MAAVTKIPSLDALPVQGVDDDLQSVISARKKLKATYTMVGQILTAPSGVPSELKTKLNNIQFHVKTALSAIDSFLYLGNLSTTPAGDVPNLRTAIQNHITAIRQAKPAWNNWLKTEKPKEAPAPLPKVSAIKPGAGVPVQKQSALETVSKPTPLKTYLVIGGIAVGAIVLLKLMK